MATDPQPPDYQPAVCNIGPEDIRRRRRLGVIGLVLTVLTILSLEWSATPPATRWLLLAPVLLTVSGFLQARARFCYAFGLQGIYSQAGRKGVRPSPDALADRQKAYRLIAQVLLLSIAVTALYVVLGSRFG